MGVEWTIPLTGGVESNSKEDVLDRECRGAYSTLISGSVIAMIEKVGNLRVTTESSPWKEHPGDMI